MFFSRGHAAPVCHQAGRRAQNAAGSSGHDRSRVSYGRNVRTRTCTRDIGRCRCFSSFGLGMAELRRASRLERGTRLTLRGLCGKPIKEVAPQHHTENSRQSDGFPDLTAVDVLSDHSPDVQGRELPARRPAYNAAFFSGAQRRPSLVLRIILPKPSSGFRGRCGREGGDHVKIVIIGSGYVGLCVRRMPRRLRSHRDLRRQRRIQDSRAESEG